MNLDRNKAQAELTDNFCLIYGEEFRELFNNTGSDLIDLGIKNAREYFKEYAIHNAYGAGLATRVEFFNPGKYQTVEEMKNNITKELKPFLPSDAIAKLLIESDYPSFSTSNFAMPKNINKLSRDIKEALEGVRATPVKSVRFEYLEGFPIYKKYKSTNLTTEGGLDLEEYYYSNLKYRVEEGEDDYAMQSIALKYHAIGSVIGREQLRIETVNKIKQTITEDIDRNVRRVLSNVIDAYCFDSELDDTLLDIQSVCGEDGFLTADQVDKSLKQRYGKSPELNSDEKNLLKKMLKENKIIKKFKDF